MMVTLRFHRVTFMDKSVVGCRGCIQSLADHGMRQNPGGHDIVAHSTLVNPLIMKQTRCWRKSGGVLTVWAKTEWVWDSGSCTQIFDWGRPTFAHRRHFGRLKFPSNPRLNYWITSEFDF
jgi:hypothetical protein